GSVRGLVDVNNAVIESRGYDPIGNLISGSMAQSPIGFTGEFTKDDLVYLRARYMNPNLGTFLSLDPFEGVQNRPMSLNGYSWVEGNVPNMVDPSGNQGELPSDFADCIPELEWDFYRFVRNCRINCERKWEGWWNGINRASCQAGCGS